MKVAYVLGSPRRRGNTAKVTGWVIDEFSQMGHDVDLIDLLDVDVAPCNECYACRAKPGFPGCVIDDDLNAVHDRLAAADLLVYAFPLFCWTYPAQMKALIDRFGSLKYGYPGSDDHASRLDGKPIAQIVTCGGPEENNADLIATTLERLSVWAKTKCIGTHVFPGCVKPGDIGSDVETRAREVAKELATASMV